LSELDLVEHAYENIKQMIVDREILPGEKIQQDVLSKKLMISRTPIILALTRLASEKLVETQKNKGFIVRKFSLQEFIDIWNLRTAIEKMVVEEITPAISPAQIKMLKGIFSHFAPPWDNQKYVEYARADRKFHNELLKMSNNLFVPQIAQMCDIIRWSYQDGIIRYPEETLQEHYNLIDALETHDGPRSLKLITEHHDKSRERLEFTLMQFAKLSVSLKTNEQ
jgi:DNA-binding GntR family transcriptional regulator